MMLTHQAQFCSRAAGVIPPLGHLLFLHTVIDISSLSIVKIPALLIFMPLQTFSVNR
jgi:hypothetical protein